MRVVNQKPAQISAGRCLRQSCLISLIHALEEGASSLLAERSSLIPWENKKNVLGTSLGVSTYSLQVPCEAGQLEDSAIAKEPER